VNAGAPRPQLQKSVLEETRRDQSVKTMFGRVRPIPDINRKNSNTRGFAERPSFEPAPVERHILDLKFQLPPRSNGVGQA